MVKGADVSVQSSGEDSDGSEDSDEENEAPAAPAVPAKASAVPAVPAKAPAKASTGTAPVSIPVAPATRKEVVQPASVEVPN